MAAARAREGGGDGETGRSSPPAPQRRVEFHDGNRVVETLIEESAMDFTTMEMSELPMLDKAVVMIRTDETPGGQDPGDILASTRASNTDRGVETFGACERLPTQLVRHG